MRRIYLLVVLAILAVIIFRMRKKKNLNLNGTILRYQLSTTLKDQLNARSLMAGSRAVPQVSLPPQLDPRDDNKIIPPLNQEQCGSCHAFSTCAALSDRIRRMSKYFYRQVDFDDSVVYNQLSPYLLTGCDLCDEQKHPAIANMIRHYKRCNDGCDGGVIQYNYLYVHDNGLFSILCSQGGSQNKCIDNSNTVGKPKEDMVCLMWHFGPPEQINIYEEQELTSSQKMRDNMVAIQTEIFLNGPVSAGYMVYEDFYSFFEKNPLGVYTKSKNPGKLDGGHAIEIIGWGDDGTTPYWIVKNSWGTDWGDKGFFKIHRGVNLYGIESDVWAAKPDMQKSLASGAI